MSKLWLTSAAADGADNSLISSSYVCLCTSATSFCALNDAWHVVAGRAIQREHGSGEDPRDERSVAGLPHAAICRLRSATDVTLTKVHRHNTLCFMYVWGMVLVLVLVLMFIDETRCASSVSSTPVSFFFHHVDVESGKITMAARVSVPRCAQRRFRVQMVPNLYERWRCCRRPCRTQRSIVSGRPLPVPSLDRTLWEYLSS